MWSLEYIETFKLSLIISTIACEKQGDRERQQLFPRYLSNLVEIAIAVVIMYSVYVYIAYNSSDIKNHINVD